MTNETTSADVVEAREAFLAAAAGHGVAVRHERDRPMEGEPFMSMATAADIHAALAAQPRLPSDSVVEAAVLYLGECIANGGAKHAKIRKYLTDTFMPALAARQTETDGLAAELEGLLNAAYPKPGITRLAPERELFDWYREHGMSILAALSKTRVDALEEAAVKVHERLYPKNPKNDWTEYAKDKAEICDIATETIRALKGSDHA